MVTRLTWYDASKRLFETGLDRGVLYPKIEPAVSWDGLIAVDEGGAESASAYYLDGRPYLFLPKPKEFTATLKAYTYPDEFSNIMGTTEATDGMYLDSQQGDSFDLCYRTLIGNAEDGIDHGYKIHLIYNATVTPQGLSYSTLDSAINPIEFAWEIQAVPVPVIGYRPTAHIIIDTRHIDIEKIKEIEDLLYGLDGSVPDTLVIDGGTPTVSSNDIVDGGSPDWSSNVLIDGGYPEASSGITLSPSDPRMPAPNIIFDTLSYGDTIIITDNGDGTWKAEGSFDNLYVTNDGEFTIYNIDSVDHGNGTYDISTTV